MGLSWAETPECVVVEAYMINYDLYSGTTNRVLSQVKTTWCRSANGLCLRASDIACAGSDDLTLYGVNG